MPHSEWFGPPATSADVPELNGTFLANYADPTDGSGAFRRQGLESSNPLILQACPEPANPPDPAKALSLELILDESNLLPFAFLRRGDRVGRAVVKILRRDGAAGTGFLVAPGILLTNNHVLPDRITAETAKVSANFEAEPADDPEGRPLVVPLRPDDLFVTNSDLDFTFCGVRGLDHLGTIAPDRNSLNIRRSDYVNIIQHPRGRPKEVALQDNQVVKVDYVVIHYSCDTEPGSSGSPVFDNRWRLVALHHASVVADEADGGRRVVGANPRLRYLNEGIRLSAIALWLESAEADAPAIRDQTARLRAIFDGHDPRAGFFGARGQRAEGRNAAQRVVECYQGGVDRLDLGAWDLSDPDQPPRDRLADIGLALAMMGLDLWFLAGIGPEEAQRLREHLDGHYQLDYAALPLPVTSGPPLTVLHRRSDALSVEPVGAAGILAVSVRSNEPGAHRRDLTIALRSPNDGPTGAPDAWGRILPVGPSGLPAEPVLLALGHRLAPEQLDAFHDAGSPARLAASGPDGSLVMLDGGPLQVERVFLSPNLAPVLGASTALAVSNDRVLPPFVRSIRRHAPLAVRLLFGSSPLPALPSPVLRDEPRPGAQNEPRLPLPSSETDLEQTLSDLLSPIIARLVAEARRQRSDVSHEAAPPG